MSCEVHVWVLGDGVVAIGAWDEVLAAWVSCEGSHGLHGGIVEATGAWDEVRAAWVNCEGGDHGVHADYI